MKFRIIAAAAALLFSATAFAQVPGFAESGGPVAVGQAVLQCDPHNPAGCNPSGNTASSGVALIQAPAEKSTGGGIIQLSAFGWLEPYADTIVQALIVAFFGWIGKSKYTQWLDQSSRDALETFVKNRASSLIADGAVSLKDKALKVDNPLLYRAANEANTAIPDALKRFGLSPDVVAAKIVDAIPQTEAGAAIIASAHAENDNDPVPVAVNAAASAAPAGKNPPTTAAA